MTPYTEARERRQTQAQHRAAERARRETTRRLIEELRTEGTISGRRAARIRRAVSA